MFQRRIGKFKTFYYAVIGSLCKKGGENISVGKTIYYN